MSNMPPEVLVTVATVLSLRIVRHLIFPWQRLRGRCDSCFILKALLIARFRTYLLFGPEHGGIVVVRMHLFQFVFHLFHLSFFFGKGSLLILQLNVRCAQVDCFLPLPCPLPILPRPFDRVVDWFSFHIDPLQICFISGMYLHSKTFSGVKVTNVPRTGSSLATRHVEKKSIAPYVA
jgi:hypothetical protein